jgi:hypothetical protein
MPYYEYTCLPCDHEEERYVSDPVDRDDQLCATCGYRLTRTEIPSSQVTRADSNYVPKVVMSDGTRRETGGRTRKGIRGY